MNVIDLGARRSRAARGMSDRAASAAAIATGALAIASTAALGAVGAEESELAIAVLTPVVLAFGAAALRGRRR